MTVDPGDIVPGGETTMTIDASDHNKVECDKLWTDWEVTSVSPDGGTASISPGETPGTGTVTIEWSSTQQSSQVLITVTLPDDYVGGTYLFDASATDGSDTTETTATMTITDSGGLPGFQQQAKLVADDGDPDDRFGVRVGLSGDGSTAIIDEFNDEDPNGTDAGSAYIFMQRVVRLLTPLSESSRTIL